MTIILAMMFGATVGFSVAIGFNYNSFNRGYKEGYNEGREYGRTESQEYYDDILETIESERGR